MKELVYTGIFVGLGILLIVLLFVMFYPKKEKSSDATADVTAEAASYVPGIYNSELKLGENTLNLEVVSTKTRSNRFLLSTSMTRLQRCIRS